MNNKTKKILISAGGTGGHLFPAEALARDLIGRGYHVVLATDKRGAQYDNFADGVPTHVLQSGGLHSGVLNKLKSVFSLGVGYFQALGLIGKIKPDVVVGFGGYPSFPPVYAATQKKIPTIIHEQNAVMGKANAYLASKVDRIATAWTQVEGLTETDTMRSVVTGNPVRPDIAALYSKPYPILEQDGDLHILVMGGSQGAKVFSDIIPATLEKLSDAHKARLHIVQQCREEDIERVRSMYEQAGIKSTLANFFDDVAEEMEKCHLFIGRSGASTVSEVTTAGRPAIFVPYPHHKDQQQKRNANVVFDAGGAWVMTEDGFTANALLARIETFLQNPETLFNAAENARTCGKPDAARKLGNLVTALASGWNKKDDSPLTQ
ncbi:MAG: undecaprenyldiphospho-muramoylpentapeptide beta-N-acetylglucosaminyltransferase [Pseudomonadota bacterium]